MPELPEVETSVRGISSLIGEKIQQIKIHILKLRWPIKENDFLNLEDRKIVSIYRRAKYIIFNCEEKFLVLHLGMTGTLRIIPTKSNEYKKHDHVELIFKKNKLIFNDPRRFGSIHTTNNINEHFLIKNLGVEPLDEVFNEDYLYTKIKKSNASIKSLIMNQKIVVGIGNIYANEILFLSRINPRKKGKYITRKNASEITKHSKSILRKAIDAGGTTLQDFFSPSGNKGYFKVDLNVYDREGEKCFDCSDLIKRIEQNQRSTFLCRNCQS
mgnify:FL=1